MINLCKRFLAETSGATAIEYAMISAMILLAIVTAVSTLGSSVATNLYDKIAAVL